MFQYCEEREECSGYFLLRTAEQEKTRASYPFHLRKRQILFATYLYIKRMNSN